MQHLQSRCPELCEGPLTNVRYTINMSHYVYILTNKSNTLYVGSTNNLKRRLYEHKIRKTYHFTAKYRINKLIYYSIFDTALEAIQTERRIKGWTRKRKIELIKSQNPEFQDLLDESEINSGILRPMDSG